MEEKDEWRGLENTEGGLSRVAVRGRTHVGKTFCGDPEERLALVRGEFSEKD